MAHIGNLYELHFRRDICLACTQHRVSIPLAWWFTANVTVVSGGITVYTFGPSKAELTTDPDDPVPIWMTPPITSLGKTVDWGVRFFDWEIADQRTRFQLWGENSGNEVLRQTPNRNLPGNCGQYGNQTSPTGTEFFDPTFWGGTVASALVFARGWRWTD